MKTSSSLSAPVASSRRSSTDARTVFVTLFGAGSLVWLPERRPMIYMQVKARPIYVVRSVTQRRHAPGARQAPDVSDARPVVATRAPSRRRFS